jgi:cellulose synthase/poly-beta-1,6-N-acetylglucosamine synthase-like glycosyltransferase
MSSLYDALVTASPRLTPRRTPLASVLIHGSVLALWIILFARAFGVHGVLAWATGVFYAGYDTVLLLFVAWQTLPLAGRPPAPRPAAAERPTLGAIVAAYNEAPVLKATVDALYDQLDPPDQVLIADDGSTDDTAAVMLKEYGIEAPAVGELSAESPVRPGLFWLRAPHGGKARALNAAILKSTTDIVLTVDADTLLAPDALQVMRRSFAEEPELVAATGVLTPVCSDTAAGRFLQWFQTYEYIRNFISRFAWMEADSLLLISGAFAGFRRQPVLTVGGFDPACLVEDYELIHRLHRYAVEHGLAWQVRVLGAARARTDAPSTIPAFLRQRRRWFAGFLQTQYWNRDLTGNGKFGRLGTWMMPVKAIDTMQPIFGLTAFGLLIAFLISGRLAIVLPVFSIISAKIVLDLGFHLWSVHLYRRWTGGAAGTSMVHAIVVALLEPFSFQLLRHVGAAWGWVMFFTGRQSWGRQHRFGLLSPGSQQEI